MTMINRWHMPYDYTPRHLAYVLHALIELPPPAEHDAQAQVRNSLYLPLHLPNTNIPNAPNRAGR